MSNGLLKKNSVVAKYTAATIFTIIFSSAAHAMPQDPYPFTSAADSNRFYSLTKEIRCVVCQNQDIADSSAPLANDLRNKVYLMVKEKKSDADIKDYLVKRYGEFILLRPRLNTLTGPLWLFPVIGLLGVMLFLWRFVKRKKLTAPK